MRRMLFLAVLLVGALWAVQPRLAAQKQGQLFVSLIDASGAPVVDLQPGDVMISEDGVVCKTLKLEPIDWPVKLQVLVDNGGNNTSPITPLRDGLSALFEQIHDGVEMSMYTTSPQPRTIVKPTTDKQQLVKGIGRIPPDGGAGAFLDALFEASVRTDQDRTPHFPVVLMVGSDFGRFQTNDRDYQRLQENILKHAMTVHIVLMSAGATAVASGGGGQTEIGAVVTKLSGGRYDTVTATRLSTLLREIGKQIAQSAARERHQYRVTYERPANAKPTSQVSAAIGREGTPVFTVDGRIP